MTITHIDALVLARSQFHHSANYRSVVVHGRARLVTDEDEKSTALTAVVEKIGRGRSMQTRPPNRRELEATAVIAVPLSEVSVKARMGGVGDDEEDLALPHWAGVVPLRLTPGIAEPAPGVTAPVPDYLRPVRTPWYTPEPMRGEHVILEPLDMSHVDGLYEALDHEAVYEFQPRRKPTCRDDMARYVAEALLMHQQGQRVP